MLPTTGGISRRRVATTNNPTSNYSGATPHYSDDEDEDRRRTTPSTQRGSPHSPDRPSSSSAALANGTSAGADADSPTNGSAKRERDPSLTLMEEILLLGLKDNEGYLSFWNDNLSYVLRACILMELALRKRIRIMKDAYTGMVDLMHRKVEVISTRSTGEVLLDEALKLMKREQRSVMSWIDLLSGETWNISKASYQLKQVRERLAKGLVEKSVLRTEKRNFLLFDMATHPVQDRRCKSEVVERLKQTVGMGAIVPLSTQWYREESTRYWKLRRVCLAAAALAANVIENPLMFLPLDERDYYISRAENILDAYSRWPNKKSPDLPPAGDVELSITEVIACILTVLRKMDRII